MPRSKCWWTGCSASVKEQGLCESHLGQLLAPPKKSRRKRKFSRNHFPKAERETGMSFLRRHRHHTGDRCLIFPCGNSPAVAVVTMNGKPVKATRAMCILAHGLPPEDKPMALHSCGNGHLGCVNPRHLYWGDAGDNAKDAHRHRKAGKVIEIGNSLKSCTSAQATKTRMILVRDHLAEQSKLGGR